MAFPRSVSVNRPPHPSAVVEEGGPGGGGNAVPAFSGDAPGCPRIDDRDVGRPDGRPRFDLTLLLAELGAWGYQLRHPRVGLLRFHALRG